MIVDVTNPMQDALDTIRATDVISNEKKRALIRALEEFRRQNCTPAPSCEECATHARCLSAIADVLGS
ncbi:hypothetical protein [Azospirillum picis]|uniref:Endonuclease III n=1 Tax=Azospirillum picis TaxID=488438 RepID=A0ABU0MTR0_9PROT|nr:hypothetical protein [Azospirillum picis]MBP2303124.1 endonuclease III [Azospirillum picis]MDQ0536876.1 endonuclease III [Azospirillum picis]